MSEIDKFERHLGKKYKVAREKIQDAERLCVSSLDKHVEIDFFFNTGRIRVSGRKCGLKFEVEELRDNYGKDVNYFEKLDSGEADKSFRSLQQHGEHLDGCSCSLSFAPFLRSSPERTSTS